MYTIVFGLIEGELLPPYSPNLEPFSQENIDLFYSYIKNKEPSQISKFANSFDYGGKLIKLIVGGEFEFPEGVEIIGSYADGCCAHAICLALCLGIKVIAPEKYLFYTANHVPLLDSVKYITTLKDFSDEQCLVDTGFGKPTDDFKYEFVDGVHIFENNCKY